MSIDINNLYGTGFTFVLVVHSVDSVQSLDLSGSFILHSLNLFSGETCSKATDGVDGARYGKQSAGVVYSNVAKIAANFFVKL